MKLIEHGGSAAIPGGCGVRIIAFDFERRSDQELSPTELPATFARGCFAWIDVSFSDPQAIRPWLEALGLIASEVIEDALEREPATQIARYPDYVHFVVSGCRLAEQGLELARVDCALSARFLLTLHRGGVPFIDAMRRAYHEDFERFARTPSFLVYELWDQLTDSYLALQRALEARVEALQVQLMAAGDGDDVFARVAELGADLLRFRQVVLPARAVLSDLGTRRSLFVSETTQSFLVNVVGSLEHVLQDVLVDRDILTESLNLYVSLVAHRTNQVMKKLTVVSVIFLPLTFLCGVYGMNFRYLPELEWPHGYAAFWLTVAGIVAVVAWLCRRSRLW